MNLSDVEEIKHIQFRGSPSIGGVISATMNQNFNSVHFQPDFVIVNSVQLNAAASTARLYPLYWNVTNDYFVTISGDCVVVSPNSFFKVQKPIDQITITMNVLNVDGTITAPTALAGDYYLTVDMTLVSLKKYNPHSSIQK